jgi:hypothetical protein
MATVHEMSTLLQQHFDAEQCQEMVDEDLSAGRFVAAELFLIVLGGAVLMAFTVAYTVL